MQVFSLPAAVRAERRSVSRFVPHRNVNSARRVRMPSAAVLPLREVSPDDAFRIATGCIALYQLLPDGRRQILDILGPGRLIHRQITDSAACIAETLCPTQLDRRRLADAQDTADWVAAALLMLRRAQQHAMLLGRKTALERVAFAVLDLAQQFGARLRGVAYAEVIFRLHLTRTDLADWLGLTGETVSRTLNALKRQEIIGFDTPEIVTIKNLKALQTLAGETPASLRTLDCLPGYILTGDTHVKTR